MNLHSQICAAAVLAALALPGNAQAEAWFVTPAGLASASAQGPAPAQSVSASRIHVLASHPHAWKPERYWGQAAGQPIVSLAADEPAPAEVDHHCGDHAEARPFVLTGPAGEASALVSARAIRAFPSPDGAKVAVITPERDLLLWNSSSGATTSITLEGRVSAVGWRGDSQLAALTVYPPDWTPNAVSQAETNAEFLRFQNANIHILDAESRTVSEPITTDPGTEYGGFFSPDGAHLYYVWLHLHEDEGGLMRVPVDKTGRPTGPAAKLTVAGEDQGEVPLGRVGTYQFSADGSAFIFEAGRPDGGGVIWTMAASGTAARAIAPGRHPQRIADGSFMYLADSTSAPENISTAALAREESQ